MQISLRSHLIAGTAAVVGASAIAVTPVTAAHLDLPTIKAPAVALKAFTPPLVALAGTLFQAGSYLFNTDLSPINPDAWAFSGIEAGTGTAGALFWPALLSNPGGLAPELGGFSSVGLIPQIIDDALPIISQLGYNGSDYLQATLGALYASTDYLIGGIWEAAGQLLSFDIQGAFDTVLTSISQTGSILLAAGGYVLSGVVNRATAVVNALVGGLGTLVGATLRQVQVIGDSVATAATNIFNAIGGGDIEGAWNALVEGFLGANGVPGTIVNLTLGAGVQTGPISGNTEAELAASIEANFVPSIRGEVQGLVKVVADALATPVSGAAAVAPAAAAEVEAPAAAAAVEVEAPAAGAAAEAVEVSAADVKADTKAEAAPAAEVSAADVKAEAATGEAAAEEAPAAEAPAAEAPAAPAAEASEAKSAPTPKRVNRGAAKRGAAA